MNAGKGVPLHVASKAAKGVPFPVFAANEATAPLPSAAQPLPAVRPPTLRMPEPEPAKPPKYILSQPTRLSALPAQTARSAPDQTTRSAISLPGARARSPWVVGAAAGALGLTLILGGTQLWRRWHALAQIVLRQATVKVNLDTIAVVIVDGQSNPPASRLEAAVAAHRPHEIRVRARGVAEQVVAIPALDVGVVYRVNLELHQPANVAFPP